MDGYLQASHGAILAPNTVRTASRCGYYQKADRGKLPCTFIACFVQLEITQQCTTASDACSVLRNLASSLFFFISPFLPQFDAPGTKGTNNETVTTVKKMRTGLKTNVSLLPQDISKKTKHTHKKHKLKNITQCGKTQITLCTVMIQNPLAHC